MAFEGLAADDGSEDRAAIAAELGQRLLVKFGRHPWLMMASTMANQAAGRTTAAAATLDELAARAQTTYVQPLTHAVCAMIVGRTDEAFAYLNRAIDIQDPMFALVAAQWPGLARYRDRPEFHALLARIGWDRAIAPAAPVPPPTRRGD
jgi:predicted Zn-dependent protease